MADRNELLGYAVPMVAKPGDTVQIMVSTEADHYEAEIVRLIHGDTNPDGPGLKTERVDLDVNGSYPGRRQEIHTGSFVEVTSAVALDGGTGISIQAWIWPTTPDLDTPQGIVARHDGLRGYGLFVEDGGVSLHIGTDRLATPAGLVAQRWYFVAATYDAVSGNATVEWRLVEPRTERREASSGTLAGQADATGLSLLLAAGRLRSSGHPAALECYNGKIGRPCVYSRAIVPAELELIAAGADPLQVDDMASVWDFSASDASGSIITDLGPSKCHGKAVNYPMRGLTDHTWDGSTFTRHGASHSYGAIHFHADDFIDARWKPDFEFVVPSDLRSGYYAAHLKGAGEFDHVPFFVSPPEGAPPAGIGYLVPTNTYLAYANERLLTSVGDHDFSGLTNIPIELHPLDEFLGEHPEYGGSLYDRHADGSGIAYSSSRRPIVSMRPTHRHWVTGGPRGLAFDLYLVDWLEEKGFGYDIFTDEDLHLQGLESLARYKVVITGSHPEYWSRQMLDALDEYLDQGGRLMYLGGNGFYWVTAFDPEQSHVIEVRRGLAGSRVWNSHPGEQELASTGEMCGIWRHLGRAPNSIVGVGFAGQGWDLKTPGYRRLPDSQDARAAFIFDKVGIDEEIGEFGLVMNGTAGDELDRTDHALGTPSHALVLATSAGLHSDYFLVCHEDVLVTEKRIHGSDNPNVRADMVYFEAPNDGAVFSVGSINWFSGLSHNGYNNNVSQITENVLRRFAL